MSQYVTDENHEGVQVASNLGWHDFCDWALRFDAAEFPWLTHLAREGYANEATDLADEIERAADQDPPDEDTEDVAAGLVEWLRTVPDAEIILVNNGITSNDVVGDGEEAGQAE